MALFEETALGLCFTARGMTLDVKGTAFTVRVAFVRAVVQSKRRVSLRWRAVPELRVCKHKQSVMSEQTHNSQQAVVCVLTAIVTLLPGWLYSQSFCQKIPKTVRPALDWGKDACVCP